MGKLKKKVSLLVNSKRYYKIPWFEDYCINIDGEIRLFNNPDIIIERFNIDRGCDLVALRQDNAIMLIRLDRLMMNIFVGKMTYPIIHKDYDIDNCSIKNLKYDVPYEDMKSHIFDGKEFRQIPEFSRYYISDDAIIWNDRSKIFMRIGYDLQHYPNLHMINDDGKDIHTKPHILLMNTWGPKKKDPRMVCNHKDSIEYHNVLDNLEWVYQSENIYQSFITGDQKYELIADREDVHKACKMIAYGDSNKKIIDALFGDNIIQKDYKRYNRWLNEIGAKRIWRSVSVNYF